MHTIATPEAFPVWRLSRTASEGRAVFLVDPRSLATVEPRTLVRTIDGLRPRCSAFPPANPCDAE